MENSQLSDRAKRIVLMVADFILLPAILYVSVVLRYGAIKDVTGYWWLFPVAAIAGVISFHRLGLYRAIVRYIGPSSLLSVVHGVSIATIVVAITAYLTPSAGFPRSVPVIFWFISILCIGGWRLLIRGYFYGFFKGYLSREAVAIYGAGAAGAQLAVALLNGTSTVPVAFFDDNRALRRKTIHGVRVYSPKDMESVIEQFGIRQVLLAMPSASADKRREILDRITSLRVQVKTVPELSDLISGKAQPADVREVNLEDLLGRESVPPNPDLLAVSVTNLTVMVTGGGGSIGSELARILVVNRPKKLILLDNSEYNLFRVDRELEELKLASHVDTEILMVLGSVTDRKLMSHLIGFHRVDTIYHAAAYKHVHMVEQNPIVGVFNNVVGTRIVAELAIEKRVKRFVLVSSDKAVNPMNVMGATKRIAEVITHSLSEEESSVTFTSVRFGNVLGSSGSVVPLFHEQISAGGPVTVTHKDATRYFMTIPEAAELVIQAAGMASGGEVYVLDMGPPVSIDELARKMISLSGRENIEIEYTGLRQGEKLREELMISDQVTGTEHPNILQTWDEVVPWSKLRSDLDEIDHCCQTFDFAGLSALMERYCPGIRTLQPPVEHKPVSGVVKPLKSG